MMQATLGYVRGAAPNLEMGGQQTQTRSSKAGWPKVSAGNGTNIGDPSTNSTVGKPKLEVGSRPGSARHGRFRTSTFEDPAEFATKGVESRQIRNFA